MHCYNYSTDDSTSPRNYGYPLQVTHLVEPGVQYQYNMHLAPRRYLDEFHAHFDTLRSMFITIIIHTAKPYHPVLINTLEYVMNCPDIMK
jgi:hypothetical protein